MGLDLYSIRTSFSGIRSEFNKYGCKRSGIRENCYAYALRTQRNCVIGISNETFAHFGVSYYHKIYEVSSHSHFNQRNESFLSKGYLWRQPIVAILMHPICLNTQIFFEAWRNLGARYTYSVLSNY